jgi:hypothetical protein
MAIYAGENQFSGFDDLVRKKREDVANKSAEKVKRIQQGKIAFLNANEPTRVTFDDIHGKGTDSDSGYFTTNDGTEFGLRAPDIDSAEHAKYRKETTLRPYQKEHYAKLWGVHPDTINDAQVFAMGKKADALFNKLATEGQGTLGDDGLITEKPGEQFQDFGDQLWFPEADVTYDPTSTRREGSTRVKGKVINPATGVDAYAAMNTPEFNTRWFDKNAKQTAIREAYEAKHGNGYEQFKSLNAIPAAVSTKMYEVDKNARYNRVIQGGHFNTDQTEIIPDSVKKVGTAGKVNIITNKNDFSVYFPKRDNKPGFYKEGLTLEEAQTWKIIIESNPDAEHRSATSVLDYFRSTDPWKDSANRIVSGAVSVKEGLLRAIDVGPMTRKEGVDQWNSYVISTNDPVHGPGGFVIDTSVEPIDLNEQITEADQAKYLEVFAKQQLGEALTEEDNAFIQLGKYKYLNELDDLVKGKHERDAASLSKEAAAAAKVNRRTAGYQAEMAEEIYNHSGWDYLTYSLGNRKMSAAHSLVESSAFMVQLAAPYVGITTAIVSAQENSKREYLEINGKLPEGADLALLNSLSVFKIYAERLGLKAITGRLPNLNKWVSEIGIKNPLVAKVVKPVVAVIAPAIIEGTSGLISDTADVISKHGIQEDGSIVLPTGFEASEAFVNEAMAGGTISAPTSATKAAVQSDTGQTVLKTVLPKVVTDIVAPDIKTIVTQITKRTDILTKDDLSDKQRTNVEKSRDKLVNKLIDQRNQKIKGYQAKYGDTRKDELDIDAYLDEVNTIALSEKGLDKSVLNSMHLAQLSYSLLETLKKGKDKKDIDLRLIAALKRGLKRYEEQIEIDMVLATSGNFTSANVDTVDTVNAAKERIRAHEENQAKANIQYIIEDYAELTTKMPHKKGLYEAQRDKEIATIKESLKTTLEKIGSNISVGETAVKGDVQEAKEDNRLTFTPVNGVDVKSTSYDPLKEVMLTLSILDNKVDDADKTIELMQHTKNLQTVIGSLRRQGKSDAEIQNYIDALGEAEDVIANISSKKTDRDAAGPIKIDAKDNVLHSLEISETNEEEINKLDENTDDLTDDQKEILATQKNRIKIDKRRNKTMGSVSKEVLHDEGGKSQSFDGYAKQAQEGNANKRVLNRLDNFVRHMSKKAEVLANALEISKQEDVEAVFINKTDLNADPLIMKTGESLPEGVELDNTIDNPSIEKPITHYYISQTGQSANVSFEKDYSAPFVESVQTEAEYGVATRKLITQVLTAKTKTKVESKEFSLVQEKQIEVLLKQQTEETGELSDIGKDTEVTPTVTPEAAPVEAVQTESVEAETVETTPVPEVKVETKVETKVAGKFQEGDEVIVSAGGLKVGTNFQGAAKYETGKESFKGTVASKYRFDDGKGSYYIQVTQHFNDGTSKFWPEVPVNMVQHVSLLKTKPTESKKEKQLKKGQKALDAGKAIKVQYRNKSYIVSGKDEIMSMATGNIVYKDANHGVRKGILQSVAKIRKQTPVKPEETTHTKAVNTFTKIESRLKKANKKTAVKQDDTLKSLASTNGEKITFNIKAIAEDYDGGMLYLDGKGKGIHKDTSIQKAEVFADVDVEALKQHFLDNGGVSAYIEFIFQHELGHIAHKDRKKYPRKDGKIDLMHPEAIAIEIAANNYAFTKIGYTPTSKAQKPEVETKTVPAKVSKDAGIDSDAKVVDTEVSDIFVVGLTGDTFLSGNSGVFVPLLDTKGGNVTDLLEVKDKEREVIRVFTNDGEFTADTIRAQAKAAVEQANKNRKAEGKEPIVASPEYVDAIINLFEAYKELYKKSNTSKDKTSLRKTNKTGDFGVYARDALDSLHIVDVDGNETLPDEVLLALATQSLSFISTESTQIKNLDDTTIKFILGLDKQNKISNKERTTVKRIGMPGYMLNNDLGNNILTNLNVQAKNKRSKDLKDFPLSPLEYQDNLASSLGLLALTMLTQVDAATILPKQITKQKVSEPFLLFFRGNPVLPKREDGEGNGLFTGENTLNTVLSNVHKHGIDAKENRKALKFLRDEAAHLEAITGLEVSKTGVYSTPVKEIQTKIPGSLSPVAEADQDLIEKLQNTPQKGMKGPLRAWNALTRDQKEEIAGVVKDVKAEHWDRQDSFTASNEALMAEIDSMDAYEDDIFYYKYRVQKQGRMMISSAGINPMNSKIHRHLVSAVSNPTTINTPRLRNAFKLAVAASFGFSIDKHNAKPAIDFFDTVYQHPVVKAAYTILKDSKSTDIEISEAIMAVHNLKDVDGKPLYANKVHLIEGLAGLADYRPGASTQFTTDMTAEIDGITNGYAIALLQFGGPNLLASLQRIGVYNTIHDTEFGEWIQNEGNSDVYQELAKMMNAARDVSSIFNFHQEELEKLRRKPGKAAKNQARYKREVINRLTKGGKLKPEMLHALEEAHGEILHEGVITDFARDLAKDPLMTSNYGAALASILAKVADSAMDDILDKLAAIQKDYNAGNTEKAIVAAQRLDIAITSLRGGIGEQQGFVKKLEGNALSTVLFTTLPEELTDKNRKKLYPATLENEKIIREIKAGISFIYAPMLDTGLKSLLGDPEDTNSLMWRRMQASSAFEWTFHIYMDAYEEAIETKRIANLKNNRKTVTPEQKRDIARSLIGTYYPRYKGPVHKSDKEADSFIAMISHGRTPNSRANNTVHIDHEYYPHETDKEGNFTSSGISVAKSTSAPKTDQMPQSGGSKVQANTIQNRDAGHIAKVSEKFEFLTLYDAGIFSISDLDAGSKVYNNDFMQSNLEHSILGSILEDFEKVVALAIKEGRIARAEYTYKNGLNLKKVKLNVPRTLPISIAHEAKQLTSAKKLKALTVINQLANLRHAFEGAQADLAIVKDLFERGELTINQLYWPNLDKVEGKTNTKKLGSLGKVNTAEIDKKFKRNSISHLTQDIFDQLKDLHIDPKASTKEAKAQREHLEEILQKFIIPSAAILDSTSIEVITRRTNESDGEFDPDAKHIEVNVNKFAPKTRTQQTPQEVYVHELIHAISYKVIMQDSKIRNELTRLHREMRKVVTWKDFMHPDPTGDLAAEEAAAKEMYEYVFGKDSKVIKRAPHEFLAYALTNPGLTRKLRELDAVKHTDTETKSPLKRLFNIFNRIITSFQESFYSNRKYSSSVYDQIANIAEEIVAINTDKRNVLSRFLFRHGISAKHKSANQKIIDFQNIVIKKGIPKALEVAQRRRNELKGKILPTDGLLKKIVKGVTVNVPLAVLLLTPSEMRRSITNMHYTFRGEIAKTFRSLIGEITGITPQEFLDMVLESRHAIDASRTQTKESIHSILQKSFISATDPTEVELESITRFILKTDASTLLHQGAFTVEEIIELFKEPKKLAKALRKYGQALNLSNHTYYAAQTDGLSDIMVAGETETTHQYLNAYSISLDKHGDTKDEHNLDILITLQAIHKTINNQDGMLDAFLKLTDREMAADAEFNGFTEMLYQHRAFKLESINELFDNDKALMNKGYISVITDQDRDLIVEPLKVPDLDKQGKPRVDSNGNVRMLDNVKILKSKGYTKVEKLKGINGIDQSELAIFIGKNIVDVPRTKGINSVTARKAKGTSLKEIIARNPAYEGQIKRMVGEFFKQENAKEARQLKHGVNKTGRKQLIPLTNSDNQITDYRVSMSHANIEKHLDQDMNSIEILSTMFMRKSDKAATLKINVRSVELMVADADKNRTKKNAKKWVNIYDKAHKEEYYSTLPKQMRFDIDQNSTYDDKGNREFWVQEGLLDTIFGYKHRTMMNLPLIRDMHATRRIVGIVEKAIKGLVKQAVINIVIKIPIVIKDNILSNIYASIVHGIPPTYLSKHINRGWQELETYRDNMEELAELRHRVAARPHLASKPEIKRKMEELASDINSSDMHQFMSSGLFTSITEDIHGFDMKTRSKTGRWLKDKTGMTVPRPVTSAVGMAYMSADSKLGKAAMHATQISDFLFRYAMYKHKTEEQGVSHAEAWRLITRLFVNYDQPMNRNIQYMNDMGIYMFVRYFLRIQSMVVGLARKEPINLATFLAIEAALDIDLADVTDSSMLSGKLLPSDGGIAKILKEVIIPPTWEIATGEGW